MRNHSRIALLLTFIAVLTIMTAPVALASAPADPADFIAAATDTGISLTWSDNASNELGYRVERQETIAGSWSIIGTLPTDVMAFNDTGFTPGSSYGYRVIAFNNDGDFSLPTLPPLQRLAP